MLPNSRGLHSNPQIEREGAVGGGEKIHLPGDSQASGDTTLAAQKGSQGLAFLTFVPLNISLVTVVHGPEAEATRLVHSAFLGLARAHCILKNLSVGPVGAARSRP